MAYAPEQDSGKKAGGGRRFDPRSARRAPVGLSSVCIEAICRAFPILSGPSGPQGAVLRLQRPQEGFEGLWITWLRIGREIGDLWVA
jgi:hypothetical protein